MKRYFIDGSCECGRIDDAAAYEHESGEWIKYEDYAAEKANGIKPQLCDSLPDDKEIEFVASDESNGVDVDDLKSRPIWADGFIEGAKWMRSRIK